MMKVYFSDYFQVEQSVIEDYGAFNVSLITDLPLFIDPFLLFNSKDENYKKLHENILKYLRFLKDKSVNTIVNDGLLKAWYQFPEIKQNWLGFCKSGNSGSGLGPKFAKALNKNLNTIFTDFGSERVTKGSHLEKLCLIGEGVGRDNISDFTTNLIHDYLLQYTQEFAKKYIKPELRRKVMVANVRFNYATESWASDYFYLPFYNGDYVLLTPKDILTRDEAWINRSDLLDSFDYVPMAITNEVLRAQVNNYFFSILPKDPKKDDKRNAVAKTIEKFPQVIDYYIKSKEDRGEVAIERSLEKVRESHELYIEQFKNLSRMLQETAFYDIDGSTYKEALDRINFLKDVVENKDGYRIFYFKGRPIKKEEDLQILYRFTWFATTSDVNREVNNGRGPVDFKISHGSKDKTLVEFKLASNSQLKKNLQNQVEIYEKANNTSSSIKAILYFTEAEFKKVSRILNELGLAGKENVILIDARSDNKPSASQAS